MHTRVQDIEDAVRWAYREELPKSDGRAGGPVGPRNPMNALARYVAFGSNIDNWTREPGFPLAMGETHPDAILIDEAVRRLDPESLDLTGFNIGYQLSLQASEPGQIIEVQRRDASSRVIVHAVGRRPDVASEREVEPVRSDATGQVTVWVSVGQYHDIGTGEPVWVGHDETVKSGGRKGYPTGAFTKVRYLPDCTEIAHDRAVYSVWHAALTALAADLEGTLASMNVTAPRAEKAPWLTSEADAKPKAALRDLRPLARRAVGRPITRSEHRSVRHLGVAA